MLAEKLKALIQLVPTTLLLFTFPLSARNEDVKIADTVVSEKLVYVGGRVKRPGPIEYRAGATVYAMIVAAGGPTEIERLKRVKVYRAGKALEFDLTNKKLRDEVTVKPNDSIDVLQPILEPR